MLFNSLSFFIFLPIAFIGYWALERFTRLQNLFVILISYVFYGWWDWRFLILIAFTSGWSYVVGVMELRGGEIGREEEWKRTVGSKLLLTISLLVNLGILGYFKYYNFFVDQALAVLRVFGFTPHLSSLKIILPVGISFYTFQALSYTIDVYRRQIIPTRDPISFFAFISFFPQLVAGPIERATNLLPQFCRERHFNYPLAVEGCRQMVWGFFKKVLVADSCAVCANSMLSADKAPSTISLWLGVMFFTFQIYGDFSGYSEIAIGCSKLFGIRLRRNFAYPYFSRDVAEFWRRWHISLTTWFRDYLYIPLGGSRCSKWKQVLNTFSIFLVSGLWHGANWTFVFWGAFHACCFFPLLCLGRNRKYVSNIVAENKLFPSGREFIQMVVTFLIVVVGWSLFRAPTLGVLCCWWRKMFSEFDVHMVATGLTSVKGEVLIPLAIMLVWEWFSRGHEVICFPSQRLLRWGIYYVLVVGILCWQPIAQDFIYFQF